ncbi:MAG: hypothetical protein ACK4M3_08090, partial [Pyrobaculum sp.]
WSFIQGGYNDGLPDGRIMNIIFSGSSPKKLEIPDTVLKDGKLDPRESIKLQQVFPYFDKCGANFEATIPVGAFAALACTTLTGGTSASACVYFLSNIGISLSHQGPQIYIFGDITNHGAYEKTGYNVSEYVYMAVSNYQYSSGSCYYNVPVATYFETR